MYKCAICQCNTVSLKGYVKHYAMHTNVPNASFPCAFAGCRNSYTLYTSFKSHFLRQHGSQVKRIKENRKRNVDLCCNMEHCKMKCVGISNLFSHLRHHISQGDPINCPFKGCNKTFLKVGSFSSHLSRLHKDWLPSSIDSSCLPMPDDFVESYVDRPTNENFDQNDSCSFLVDVDCGDENGDSLPNMESDKTFGSDLMKKLALFCLTLQSKHHVPVSVIQTVLTEFQCISEFNSGYISGQIRAKLNSFDIKGDKLPSQFIDEVVRFVKTDPISTILNQEDGQLRTQQTRKTFLKKNFDYIEPLAYKISGVVDDKRKYFHYVPIIESLEALFKDPGIGNYLLPKQHREGYMYDFNDGSVFQNNQFFSDNPEAIQLLLYQDSFEIVNPLGSAKKKHKILAMYYSLGNLHSCIRSVVDTMQLVLLCKENDLKKLGSEGPGTVFGPVIRDLKKLETEGITIGNGLEKRKGTVAFVLGDNLGSHMFGGFIENFSSVSHCCRYCLIPKLDIDAGITLPMAYEQRTKENYEACIQEVIQTETSHVKGVKMNSVLNEIAYFHVTNPSLPPCLGHDLFEGIIKVDLYLILKNLTNRKLFSYDQLNTRVERFKFKGAEALDKPPRMTDKCISGHAVQVWCFLRMLPLLIGDKIQDTNDPVWRLLIQLRSVVEHVCRPTYTVAQVVDMNEVIEEYLYSRSENFPLETLKPKHHFLAHYPQLTMQCGPLIRLWTLRFESKHAYFTKAIRSSQNFINVTQSLSEKLQLLQALYAAGSLFRQPLSYGHDGQKQDNAGPFNLKIYSPEFQKAVNESQYDINNENTIVCTKVYFNGVIYKNGSVV